MKLDLRCIALCTFLGMLSGCAKEPINCADPALLTRVSYLVVSQVFEGNPSQLREAGQGLKIGEASAIAYDPHLSTTACSARLVLPPIDSITLKYESRSAEGNSSLQMNALTLGEVKRVRTLLRDAGVALPLSLRSMGGMYPFDAIDHPVLATLLRDVLGDQYNIFRDRMQVGSGLRRDGDLLIGEGCKAHFCGSDNASFAVDVRTHRIVAKMVIDGQKPLLFGIQKAEQFPPAMQE